MYEGKRCSVEMEQRFIISSVFSKRQANSPASRSYIAVEVA
jgi:hypothetical protein